MGAYCPQITSWGKNPLLAGAGLTASFKQRSYNELPFSIHRINTREMLHSLQKLISLASLTLLSISLLIHFGFEPAKNDAEAASNTSESPIVIKGDLDSVDWDSMIGQQIEISGDLLIVDHFDLLRRGRIKVARERLFVPTNDIDPNDADPSGTSFEGGSNVANINKAQKYNDNATLIIDDGAEKQNVFPPVLFPGLGTDFPTVRTGSILKGISGKLYKKRNTILLVPDGPIDWVPAKRPSCPSVGEASVKVASFNVLNYFTKIDDGKNRARGADSKSEFKRQESKLVSAITTIDADVVGLMELENSLEAENELVAALNREVGKDVYQGCGLPKGFGDAPGGINAIRVGIIYRSDRVKAIGDVSMVNDSAFYGARTPFVQQFAPKTGGKPFHLIVNHFKSKGGSTNADPDNKNKGDGQGAFNADRRSQALAICNYIEELNQKATPRVLVVGDLNAYEQEDPIDAMRSRGLVDLQEKSSANKDGKHYSYIYFGQAGALDHAFATKSLAKDVTGVAAWHINSDEPRFNDYNEEFNPPSLFEVNPYRSSDHDPMLIGIGD